MPEPIVVEVRDSICQIRFNRPEKKNALTLAMYAAMTAALEQAEANDQVRVILFEGTEDCFTSGNDLNDFLQAPPTGPSSPVFGFLQALSQAGKPVVAAVHGVAVGIGTTMLLHCDLAYAGEGARFQLPFVNLGLVPEAGSSYLLPLLMGHRRAAELLMLGEFFGAAQALALGLVNGIYPDQDLKAQVRARALQLAAKPPAALRETKALMKRASGSAVRQAMTEEGQVFVSRLQSDEAREAFQAFLERRRPDFSRFA